MLKIGITGGIGSGKSTVCKAFTVLGIPVFDADTEAKKLYDSSEDLKQQIIHVFGNEIYPDGKFDRKQLAQSVFQTPELLKRLNVIIHPLVKNQFDNWVEKQEAPYIIKEAALLIESGTYQQLDHLILVSCPIEKRITRVMKRDLVSREQVEQRIHQQLSEEEKRTFCAYEIRNDDMHLILPQVVQLHQDLLQISNRKEI